MALASETMPVAAPPVTSRPPQYHVVLLDDDDHTYQYVIEMVHRLFRVSESSAYQKAVEVDRVGRTILETTSREQAEFKCEQIHAYGKDPRIARCKGSMSAIVEAAC